jgi:hypothetical protein
MIRAQGLLDDCQLALEERFGLRVLALGLVQRREDVQAVEAAPLAARIKAVPDSDRCS